MKTITSLLSVAAHLCGSLCLAGPVETPDMPIDTSPGKTAWTFQVEAYAWLTALEGTTGVGSLVTDVDQSFSDIMDNIKMAAALRAEARHGRWGVIADGFYADLGGSGTPPGPLRSHVGLDMKQFIGELSIAYRLWESPDGFVDVYGGLRYNDLRMNFYSSANVPGIESISQEASSRVVTGITEKAAAIVQKRASAYQTVSAARRSVIERRVTAAIKAEAGSRVKRDLERKILDIRHDTRRDDRRIDPVRITRVLKAQRLALAKSTAELKVAQLRESVGAASTAAVARAEGKVEKAEQALADGLSKQLQNRVTTNESADKSWTDPIVGLRGRWNYDERWFLAGRGDIGGFGVGSDFTWTLQASVGYQITDALSAEIGYRYMDTDYSDGAFLYDMAEAGLYLGMGYRF